MTIISDEQLADYSSNDFAMKGGGSLRYIWFNYYFTDITAEYSRVFYVAHPLDDARISFRIGVML